MSTVNYTRCNRTTKMNYLLNRLEDIIGYFEYSNEEFPQMIIECIMSSEEVPDYEFDSDVVFAVNDLIQILDSISNPELTDEIVKIFKSDNLEESFEEFTERIDEFV